MRPPVVTTIVGILAVATVVAGVSTNWFVDARPRTLDSSAVAARVRQDLIDHYGAEHLPDVGWLTEVTCPPGIEVIPGASYRCNAGYQSDSDPSADRNHRRYLGGDQVRYVRVTVLDSTGEHLEISAPYLPSDDEGKAGSGAGFISRPQALSVEKGKY